MPTGKDLRNSIHKSGLKVATVAKRMGLSRGYLYELFKENNVSDDINVRLQQALQIATGNTSLKVEDLADEINNVHTPNSSKKELTGSKKNVSENEQLIDNQGNFIPLDNKSGETNLMMDNIFEMWREDRKALEKERELNREQFNKVADLFELVIGRIGNAAGALERTGKQRQGGA